MKKTIAKKTAERLQLTAEGRALLALIESHGSPTLLADKLKVNPQSVRHWLYVGSVPKNAALDVASTLKMKPQQLRPDLPADTWKPKEVSRPAKELVARTADAKLLVRLAKQFGSVKDLCAAAGCTSSEFHTWKTRGRIPAIKLPTFLELHE